MPAQAGSSQTGSARGRRGLPQLLGTRLPFFYGWVVLGCLCCAGFARQGGATATFSVFVEPLTREFGWSRTAVAGAASLGGVLAALLSPLIGPLFDRYGSRVALCLAVLGTGVAALLLSETQNLLVFYLLFCVARLNWASPFELGIYSALNNWFVARRPLANSIATVAQMVGLVAMPLIAQLAMREASWRAGWVAIGIAVLVIGLVPVWLLMVRRPEDLGLLPDNAGMRPSVDRGSAAAAPTEVTFSRRQAVRTPAFWLLLSYTVLVYPVQAGVSLHQAANLTEHGVAPTLAASIVSLFSLMSGIASALIGLMPRSVPIRYPMALGGVFLTIGCSAMIGIASAGQGAIAAALFGLGIGSMLTLLPIAWADYFGRANYGAIRGLALSAQVIAQAAGPILSGALHDWTGNYTRSLECFAALSFLSILAALSARRPRLAPS
ncbi:MAG: MFS transporter [Alphaproteobacteria bacterium]|nr:MFS transporter [Alphaproteobacteria bacterium]